MFQICCAQICHVHFHKIVLKEIRSGGTIFDGVPNVSVVTAMKEEKKRKYPSFRFCITTIIIIIIVTIVEVLYYHYYYLFLSLYFSFSSLVSFERKKKEKNERKVLNFYFISTYHICKTKKGKQNN